MDDSHNRTHLNPADRRVEDTATGNASRRFAARLRRDLTVIDREGWDSRTGTALLCHLREELVRPAVAHAAPPWLPRAQAEASAWAEVWRALQTPSVRHATNPWAALWTVARRAAKTEVVATQWQTSGHGGWVQWLRSCRGLTAAAPPVVSLDALLEAGDDVTDRPGDDAGSVTLGPRLELILELLVAAGWQQRMAHRLLVLLSVTGRGGGGRRPGWRQAAHRLELPQFQVRRVQELVLGTTDVDGLLMLLVRHGVGILEDPAVKTAAAATLTQSRPSPASFLHAVRGLSVDPGDFAVAG